MTLRPLALLALLLPLAACEPDPSKDTGEPDSAIDSVTDTEETDTEETDTDETDDSETGDTDTGCIFFHDLDKDGYGDAREPVEAPCDDPPAGAIENGGDCDDANPEVHPGVADEGCDGVDNDCDGEIDGDWDVPEDQPNLQVAVSSAPEGSLVCVAAGRHDGPLDTRGKAIHVLGWQGAESTIIQGVGGVRVVSITGGEGADTRIEGLTITGGIATEGAGIYIADASPTLTDLIIEENSCTASGTTGECKGTGVFIDGGSPLLSNLIIRRNEQEAAMTWGAGIFVAGGSPRVEYSLIQANTQVDGADRSFMLGAGIGVLRAEIELFEVQIQGNSQTYERAGTESTTLYGAGIYASESPITATALEITDNTQSCPTAYSSQGYGAGIYTATSETGAYTVDIQDLVLSGNVIESEATMTSHGYGAGLSSYGMNVILRDAWITDNTISLDSTSPLGFGAGVLLDHQDASFERVVISGNVLSSGDAAYGAGMEMESVSLAATNLILAGNRVSSTRGTARGGALFARETSLDIENADITSNTCGGSSCRGPGLNLYTSVDLILRNTNLTGHTTGSSTGRAIISEYGSVTLDADWSNFYGNGSSEFSGVTTPSAADGNLFVDPMYTDISSESAWEWDLSLGKGSPCVDAGDPGLLDADGSACDIGSHGGVGGL